MSFTASLEAIVAGDGSGLLSIHPSWGRVPLSLVARILNGFPFPSSGFTQSEGTPLLRIRDVLKNTTEAHYRGEYDPAYLVNAGELVIGMDGDFNSAIWNGRVALLNQRVCKVTPDERFYSLRFLAYALPGYLKAINNHTSAITVKHLSSYTVGDIPLPLPPLAEQQRIVAEIERQFTRLDTAVAALKRVQLQLKRYRASVLKAASEGRLVPTEAEIAQSEGRTYESGEELLRRLCVASPADPRQESALADEVALDLPEGWGCAPLGALAWDASYGTSEKCNLDSSGTPVLRIPNIVGGRIDLTDLKRLPHRDIQDRQIVAIGDFLVIRTNGSRTLVGRAALVGETLPYRCSYASYLIRFRLLNERTIQRWISVAWMGPSIRAKLESMAATSAGQYNVSLNALSRVSVPIPPLSEQVRILREVDATLSVVDAIETEVAAALQRAQSLRAALLTRAFEGKLVPQDPNDEPASALLERIRAERQAAEAAAPTPTRLARRNKKTGKPKAGVLEF